MRPAQGIGKAIALRLAADGFSIAANDIPRNSASLLEVAQAIRDLGVDALACIADVSVEEEVKNMITEVVGYFPTKRLDVVSSFTPLLDST